MIKTSKTLAAWLDEYADMVEEKGLMAAEKFSRETILTLESENTKEEK
jgi:hypothetical protein